MTGETFDGTSYWNVLKKAFYQFIFYNSTLLIVHRVNGRKVKLCRPDNFLLYEKEERQVGYSFSFVQQKESKPVLLQVLQSIGFNADTLPVDIQKCFVGCEVPLTKITPENSEREIKGIKYFTQFKKDMESC